MFGLLKTPGARFSFARSIVLLALAMSAAFVAPRSANAETLRFSIATSPQSVTIANDGDWSSVAALGARFRTTVVGEPSLPYRIINIMLPEGEAVASFDIVPKSEQVLRPATAVVRAKEVVDAEGRVVPSAGLAGRSPDGRFFPGEHGRYLATGYLHGRAIASFAVFPLRVDGPDLLLADAIELVVTTEPVSADAEIVSPRRRRDGFEARARRLFSGLVINPGMNDRYTVGKIEAADVAGGFQPSSYPSLEGSPVDYLIITTNELADEFQVLADWKTAKGVPAVVRTVEWITANSRNGVDLQETIRFFVRDAYAKWGIRYLLLGGDTDILPARYGLSRYWPLGSGTRIPTDLYYGCLDGSWNGNHDGQFGEPVIDSLDFYAEVYHARIPMSDPGQVTTMIDRIKRYESAENTDYMNRYLMLAEVLFPEDWQEGEPIQSNGTLYSELVYTTVLESTMLDVTRMYQTEELYPGAVDENRAAVLDSLNAGFNFVTHVGHGFRHTMSVGDASIISQDADTLSNDGEWFNLYMLNCTAAAFDYFCLGEHFLKNAGGGAVSVIGATESAFPFSSTYYMIEYNELLFNDHAVNIGEAFARSRLPRTPLAIAQDGGDAWTHLIYNILADPEMQLFTSEVGSAVVSHVANVGLGEQNIVFTVTSGGSPVDSAVVCLTKDDEDYAVGLTDIAGQVTVPFSTESPGSIGVVVTGLNLARHQSYIDVTAATGAHLSVASITVDDDSIGGTAGNGDGAVDAGEVVDLLIELGNSGGTGAGGVVIGVVSSDGRAAILDANASLGDIAPYATTIGTDPVRVAFDHDIPDETAIPFTVAIWDTSSMFWQDDFKKEVRAPELERTTLRIDDSATGDADGVVGAGEEFRLYYMLKNFGTGAVSGLTATIEDLDAGFVVMDGVDAFADLGPLQSQENIIGFHLSENDTISEHRLRVVVTDSYNRTMIDTIELRPPAPPDTLTFDPSLGPDRMRIEWPPSASADVANYNVYRSLSDLGPFDKSTVDLIDHAVFVDTGLAPLTEYFFYVTAIDSSGNESAPSAVRSASTNPPLVPGFPVPLPSPTSSSPAVGDIDGDGDNEIIIGSDYIHAWHADGEEVRDGDLDPRSSGVLSTHGAVFVGPVLLAHVDDAPGLDIIAADVATQSVYCLNHNGALLPGWPRAGEDQFRASPVAADLDGDGRIEVVAVDGTGVVYAWNRDGTEVVDGDANPLTDGVLYRSPATTWHYQAPAVCDIDSDFEDEIVLGTKSGAVYAINGDGTIVSGWPFNMPGEMAGGVVVGLIDGDYHYEVVVRSITGEVYVLNHDATVVPGWPRSIPYTDLDFRGTPALADLDADGSLEIVLAHHTAAPRESKVYVIDHSGADVSGWPIVFAEQAVECSPVVADINGDGDLDVMIGDESGFVHGWNRYGVTIPGFPIGLKDAVRPTPFVCDLEGDGDPDMVICSWDQNVHVYDFAGVYQPDTPWPTIHANPHRSGRAGSAVASGVEGVAFNVVVESHTVNLTWVIPGDGSASRTFDVHRAEARDGAPSGGFELVAQGLSVEGGGRLHVDDTNVIRGRHYIYKLSPQGDPEAGFYTDAIYVPVGRAELAQNYPNPFNPVTDIVYYVPENAQPAHVTLVVYDVTGARVRTLVDGLKPAGRYVALWDARDNAGNAVASGVYFYRLRLADFVATRRMTLLK